MVEGVDLLASYGDIDNRASAAAFKEAEKHVRAMKNEREAQLMREKTEAARAAKDLARNANLLARGIAARSSAAGGKG